MSKTRTKFCTEFNVVKVVEVKEDAVYKTKVLKQIWLASPNYLTEEESHDLAIEHGGEYLQPTGKADMKEVVQDKNGVWIG